MPKIISSALPLGQLIRRTDDKLLGNSFHDPSHDYPSKYVWPEYFPKLTHEDKQPTHILLVGTTGSGKSNRIANMLFNDKSEGGLYYDSCWYVTDSPGSVAIKIDEKLKRMKETLKHQGSKTSRRMYSDDRNPNFTLEMMDTPTFRRRFDKTKITKWVTQGASRIPQHTLVVFDDASKRNNALLAQLLQSGRDQGISVIVLAQQFNQANIPIDCRSLVSILGVSSTPSLSDWDSKLYIEKILKPSHPHLVVQYQQLVKDLKVGEELIFNTDNTKYWHLNKVPKKK